jgi:malate dehydrogenase (oxaloacetate-decarboxylating)
LTCSGFDTTLCSSAKEVLVVDSNGIISKNRQDLSRHKRMLAEITNQHVKVGNLEDAIVDADVFIGVSKAGLLTKDMVKSMAKDPIIFAMANPVPEIMPQDAISAGAAIVGTGRSDFPNQINNVLGFPGIFRGALDARATKITPSMLMAASLALVSCIPNPSKEKILPSPFDKSVVPKIAKAVKEQAIAEGIAQIN